MEEQPIKVKLEQDRTPNEELKKRAKELLAKYRNKLTKKAYPYLEKD